MACARGACDVLTVCVACSWCVNTCGLLILVVCVMYRWCVRARGLLMLVMSWFVCARGMSDAIAINSYFIVIFNITCQ